MTQPPLDKSEFEAALSARKELGEQLEPELVESFASKVVAEIRRQQAQATRPMKKPPMESEIAVSGTARTIETIASAIGL